MPLKGVVVSRSVVEWYSRALLVSVRTPAYRLLGFGIGVALHCALQAIDKMGWCFATPRQCLTASRSVDNLSVKEVLLWPLLNALRGASEMA
jgi:hypothetical protein